MIAENIKRLVEQQLMKKVVVFDEPEVISFVEGAIGDRCDLVWTSKDEELAPLCRGEKPDMVLMNYEASDCSRYARLLEGIRSWSSSVPILLMSGEDVLSHTPVNVNGCIMKPLRKEFLKSMLERYKIL